MPRAKAVRRKKDRSVTESRSRLQAPKRKATTPNVFHSYIDAMKAAKAAPSGWRPIHRSDGTWGVRKQVPSLSKQIADRVRAGAINRGRSRLRMGGR